MIATLARKAALSETFIRLKRLREDHDFTQLQLAAMTTIPAGTIAAWESGRVQSIDLDSMRKLAPAYGMTVEALARYLSDIALLTGDRLVITEPPSEPAKQPEPYDLGGVRTMRLALVEVADVTIHAGREAWRTVGTFSVPEDLAVGRDVVMVRVVGECLGPEIQDGDLVLIDRGQLSPRSGAIVAVLLEDGELVVKRFGVSPEDRRPILLDNTGETMRPNGARVLGTVIYLSRKVY